MKCKIIILDILNNLYEEPIVLLGHVNCVRGNETNLSLRRKRGEVEICLLDIK